MTGGRSSSSLYRNPTTYFGGVITAAAVVLTLLALLGNFAIGGANPYVGIITFLILPAFMASGLLLMVFGIVRESRRRRRAADELGPAYPHFDLNQPSTRRRFARILVGGFLIVVLMGVVGYHAFEFTESVTFCGKICHTVMEPEHTAYLASPHARVSCVECHVGSGAGWYAKSKLSGVRQVFAVLFNSYSRPIGVPIHDLRPARETCEECHWPQKFYGARLFQNPHFRYDEKNSAEQVSLLVKTGGGSPKLGQNAGIHWHMVTEHSVMLASIDSKQQQIPWVSVTSRDGTTREYVSKEYPLELEKLAVLPRQQMDCIDCHNRPTHIFEAPETAIDRAMSSGLISPNLPWIKKIAVDALVKTYTTNEEAKQGIGEEIKSFYEKNYPTIGRNLSAALEEAIDTVIGIYSRSVFPSMNVNWTTYASNIGHRNWPGCFRCHDGLHVSADGKTLSKDCTTCHTMPQRGPLMPLATTVPTSDQSWHPWVLKSKHAEIGCHRCHAAGYRPPTNCAECHKLNVEAPMMSSGCDTCHSKDQDIKPLADCTSCHEKPPGLHQSGGHPDATCTDCHKAHSWKVIGREGCMTCHDDKKAHYSDGGDCASCHEFAVEKK